MEAADKAIPATIKTAETARRIIMIFNVFPELSPANANTVDIKNMDKTIAICENDDANLRNIVILPSTDIYTILLAKSAYVKMGKQALQNVKNLAV